MRKCGDGGGRSLSWLSRADALTTLLLTFSFRHFNELEAGRAARSLRVHETTRRRPSAQRRGEVVDQIRTRPVR